MTPRRSGSKRSSVARWRRRRMAWRMSSRERVMTVSREGSEPALY